MIPIDQTEFGDGKGNCFAACVASILELPIADVPNFCRSSGNWWRGFQAWLALRWLFAFEVYKPKSASIETAATPGNAYLIASG